MITFELFPFGLIVILCPSFPKVPPEYVELERASPNSAPRFADSDGTSYNSMYLMGQSVLLITQLLLGGLLQVHELDPLRRYTPSYERNRKMGRYSVFQVTKVCLSASDRL